LTEPAADGFGTTDHATALIRRISYLDGGFAKLTLGELREIVGARRLGRFVLAEIGEWLEAHDLGYFPASVLLDNTEPRQTQEIRVFSRKDVSPIGAVVDAVQTPTALGDRLLRELNSSDSPRLIQQFQRDIWELKVQLAQVLDTFEPNVFADGGLKSADS
jgi:hypothetical protein